MGVAVNPPSRPLFVKIALALQLQQQASIRPWLCSPADRNAPENSTSLRKVRDAAVGRLRKGRPVGGQERGLALVEVCGEEVRGL